MASPSTRRQAAATPPRTRDAAVANGWETLFHAVGSGQQARQPLDSPFAALGKEWLVGGTSALQAANTMALAAIGVRPDTLNAMKPLFGVGEVPKSMDHGLGWASDWARYVATLPGRSLRSQVELRRAPLVADDQGPRQRAVLEDALVSAFCAHTRQEFGAALKEVMQATGRTQGDIVRRDSRTKKKWLSKSTVSRMANGTTIVRQREQVEAFVRACGGVSMYVEAWGLAWTQFHDTIHAARTTMAGQDDVTSVDAEPVDKTPMDTDMAGEPQNTSTADGATGSATSAGGDCTLTEDAALLDVHVRVTKEHLLRAAPVLVAMGLLSTADGRLPVGRDLVAMALLGASAIAVFSHMQRLAQADNTSISASEQSTGVYMTAPQKRDI